MGYPLHISFKKNMENTGKVPKILILDNHDDFGGHARRNEHMINGDLRLTNGGSQTFVSPHARSELVLNLLKEIGIDLDQFKSAYDVNFYKRNKLGAITYFNKQMFGEDKVVKHPYGNYPWWVEGLPRPEISHEEAARQAPLSEKGKEQLLRVLNGGLHVLDVPREELEDYMYSHSYFDYLKTNLMVDDPGVLEMARTSCSDWEGGGADVFSIGVAIDCGALGFDPVSTWKDLMGEDAFQKEVKEHGNVFAEEDPYIHHFPDGNATIARMLVKKMIPNVGIGDNAKEIVTSKFDYAELDKSSNIVRIRLNSTVVNVRHGGDPKDSSEVFVNYINDKKSYQVKGKSVVMACYNMMIPHIVSGLPEEQAAALRLQTKSPLQYTTVGLRNWRAMKEMEIGLAMSPGNMHQVVFMDFPVSIGGYEYTKTPDDPCIVHMISCPYGETIGAPALEQYREARYKMLGLQFKDYEDEIRAHFNGMLPQELFDFDRDVESITVNRWGHGYTVGGPEGSVKKGRQPFGRITIANCDSGPGADAKTAIDMASRAVNELG